MTLNFALIGAAGYIAPRHMQAIKDVGGNLVAALDPHDSVGILDRYFPDCKFFTEFERFDRFCENRRPFIDYVSICSPNYLHDTHCRFAIRIGAGVICEKPLTLNTRNLDALRDLELEYERKINVILQTRLHQSSVELAWAGWKARNNGESIDISILYNAPRGAWYDYSWKGDASKSGGLLTNIGIHLFDIVCYHFGKYKKCLNNFYHDDRNMSGQILLGDNDRDTAKVSYSISLDQGPANRTILFRGRAIDFSTGFEGLHTESYNRIIAGEGFGIDDIYEATRIVEELRHDPQRCMR